MMAGHGDDNAVGGPARHIPVLLDAVMKALGPIDGRHVVDGTFGAGGYSLAMLDAGAKVTAIDRDPDAIAEGQPLVERFAPRLRLVQAPFSTLDTVAEHPVDAVVLDVGVSSMQIDRADRGFSFRGDGPLDMRMARSGATAADVVNSYKTGDLARIFGFLGEERQAGRIARMIEGRRPFHTTKQLADAISALVGRGPKDRIHPATRVFQALRIHVNDELGELARALLAAERALAPGGRLVVVSFHSLEDRLVKRFLTDRSSLQQGSRHLPAAHIAIPTFTDVDKPVGADEAECEANPRARSARLRAATRSDAPARDSDLSFFGLPRLPEIGSSAEMR